MLYYDNTILCLDCGKELPKGKVPKMEEEYGNMIDALMSYGTTVVTGYYDSTVTGNIIQTCDKIIDEYETKNPTWQHYKREIHKSLTPNFTKLIIEGGLGSDVLIRITNNNGLVGPTIANLTKTQIGDMIKDLIDHYKNG